jgi:hypothetical protein
MCIYFILAIHMRDLILTSMNSKDKKRHLKLGGFKMLNKQFFVFVFFLGIIIILGACTSPPATPTIYTITAMAGDGGQIEPEGDISVSEGGKQVFTITAEACYRIYDVLIDGLSVGAISEYTFPEIYQNHSIQAMFVTSGPKVHNYDTGVDYSTIQAAIDTALAGQTIIACPGTYTENLVFDNKKITLRSINPIDPDIVATTIIAGADKGSVVEFMGHDESILEGFTIQKGSAFRGGGIYITVSSPTIAGNIIQGNEATYGGGIYIVSALAPHIENNTIIYNTAEHSGGGVFVVNCNSAYIKFNVIKYNMAGLYGGGIYVNNLSDLLPDDIRPDGWGTGRENIPTGDPLLPEEDLIYIIAGNKFLGNESGYTLDYNEGSHVYFSF